MSHNQVRTAQDKPETPIDRREAIALKIRQNVLVSPIEVALWAGVEAKTVTGQWIKHERLPASKIGSRTIRIEPNALIIWLREFRSKKFRRLGGGPRRGLLPVSKKLAIEGASPTASSNITTNGDLSRGNHV